MRLQSRLLLSTCQNVFVRKGVEWRLSSWAWILVTALLAVDVLGNVIPKAISLKGLPFTLGACLAGIALGLFAGPGMQRFLSRFEGRELEPWMSVAALTAFLGFVVVSLWGTRFGVVAIGATVLTLCGPIAFGELRTVMARDKS